MPSSGNRFAVLNSGTDQGTFGTTSLPGTMQVVYDPTGLLLTQP